MTEATCDLAVKIPPATEAVRENWGEWHFAVSLKRALEERGLRVRIDCQDEWYTKRRSGEVELVLRGPKPYAANPENICVYWLLFHSANLTLPELNVADFVAVASTRYLDTLNARGLAVPAQVLLQCTDPDLFRPDLAKVELASELLFVGVQHPERRNGGLVRLALRANLPVAVWGPNWEDIPEGTLRGRRIPNAQLGSYYGSACVVLNDHLASMTEHGFMNNRLFDALACGVPVISDHCEGVPDRFHEFVRVARSAEELLTAYAEVIAEGKEDSARRKAFSMEVREQHSFACRAAELEKIISQLRSSFV